MAIRTRSNRSIPPKRDDQSAGPEPGAGVLRDETGERVVVEVVLDERVPGPDRAGKPASELAPDEGLREEDGPGVGVYRVQLYIVRRGPVAAGEEETARTARLDEDAVHAVRRILPGPCREPPEHGPVRARTVPGRTRADGRVRACEADATSEVEVPRESEQPGRDRVEHDSGRFELGPHPGGTDTAPSRPQQQPGDRRLYREVEIALGPVMVPGEALAEETLAPGACKPRERENHPRHRHRHGVDAVGWRRAWKRRPGGREGRADQPGLAVQHRERRSAPERPRDPGEPLEVGRIPVGEDRDHGLAVGEPDLDRPPAERPDHRPPGKPRPGETGEESPGDASRFT